MLQIKTNQIIHAAAAATSSPSLAKDTDQAPPPPSACEAAAKPAAPAYSPIVLAGIVRALEFGLTALVGFAVYAAYVVPSEGLEWHYLAPIAGIAVMAGITPRTRSTASPPSTGFIFQFAASSAFSVAC